MISGIPVKLHKNVNPTKTRDMISGIPLKLHKNVNPTKTRDMILGIPLKLHQQFYIKMLYYSVHLLNLLT